MRSRCVLKKFATTVRDDAFASTPSPLSVRGLLLYAAWFDRSSSGKLETRCVFSCKQTHLVKCSPDSRKDKDAMDGFGDYVER